MAWICLDCGSLSWYENVATTETYELTKEGEVKLIEREYHNEMGMNDVSCNECEGSNVLWFDERKFKKSQLKRLVKTEGKDRLKVLLELSIDNNYKDVLDELIERCDWEKLMNNKLKEKLMAYLL